MITRTRRWNDGATAIVRTVWFNGKRWESTVFCNGRTNVSVFADDRQAFPKVFGTKRTAIVNRSR